jgi:hypothetical protein
MRAKVLVVIAVALFLCAVLIVGVEAYAGSFFRSRLQRAVNESCGHCELVIGSLDFGLFPPRAVLGGVAYREGDQRDSLIGVAVREVLVPLPLKNLAGGPWRVGVITLSGLSVTLEEGAQNFPHPAKSRERKIDLSFAGVLVSGAEFTYRFIAKGAIAVIQVHDIDASVEPFSTAEQDKDHPLEAHALARLENSGRVDLTVAAAFFADTPHADVDLKLSGQKLAELNPYFRPTGGFELEGLLLDAHGIGKVRGSKGEGDVLVTFNNLGVHFHSNQHRGGLLAFFENLGAKIKLKGGNLEAPRSAKERQVVTERHDRESVVSFILRTLKEAALRVAMN